MLICRTEIHCKKIMHIMLCIAYFLLKYVKPSVIGTWSGMGTITLSK